MEIFILFIHINTVEDDHAEVVCISDDENYIKSRFTAEVVDMARSYPDYHVTYANDDMVEFLDSHKERRLIVEIEKQKLKRFPNKVEYDKTLDDEDLINEAD